MTNNLIKILTTFCLFIFVASCDRPECKNTNPVFDKYSPETKEYKDELIKQLKLIDNSKLTYWFDKYQKDNEHEYIYINIQGDGLCAKSMVTVKQWDKLAGIQKTEGKGYSGAKLKNFKFEIYQDSTKTELVYKSVDAIID